MACETCGGNHKHGTPCGISPEVLQINNQECVLFHKVEIPASMGDETTIPPEAGKYKNVLLYYEATGNAYLYSSDGVPAKLTYATDDYNALANKPSVNGVILSGGMSLSDLGIQQLLDAKQDALTAGDNIIIENNVISATGGGSGSTATITLATASDTWSGDSLDAIKSVYDNGGTVIVKTDNGSVQASTIQFNTYDGEVLSAKISIFDGVIGETLTLESDGAYSLYRAELGNNVVTYNLQERYGVDPLDYRMSNPGTMTEEAYNQMKEDLEAGIYSDGYPDGGTSTYARLVYHSYGSIQGVITDFEKELNEETEEETIMLHTTIYTFFFVRTKSGDEFQYKYYYRLKDINYI